MMDPLFHDFLVERAKFPFPDCPIGASASSTHLSGLDVGYLDDEWKAHHAVRDNDLADKLCNTLRTTLGEMTVTEDSRNVLSRWFLPDLLGGHRVDQDWLENSSEAQSKRLLNFGVFKAAAGCLFEYGQSKFQIPPEQKAEVANSIVDFHVLVDGKLVALVEAKSPTVMKKLGELLPQLQNAFKIRWTPGSTSLVSLVFSEAALYLGLQQIEWLFLTCHNYWIVLRLVKGGSKTPFLAFSPLITMEDSSVPFRSFLSAVLSVVKGGVVEASVFDDPQTLNAIEGEAPGKEGFPSSGSNDNDSSGRGPCRGPSGEGSAICGNPTQDAPNLTVSSSSPLASPSSQVLIHVHALPNNIFGLPPTPHAGERRLWLTRSLGHGSTGRVYECRFGNFERPFAAKVIEMLCSSDIEARKRLRNEFDIYIAMEKVYQSGKLQNRIAPRCYGAFEGKYIDVLILDLHNNVLSSWDDLKPPERLEIFKLVCDLHSLGIAHGDLEPRNVVRTDEGKFLLIDFTHSYRHRRKTCVAQHVTDSMGESIPLKGYKCDELNMLGKLIGRPLTISPPTM